VLSAATRAALSERAFSILIDVDAATAWERARNSGRPLAQDEGQFHALYEERRPVYEEVAEATAEDADDVVLAAAEVHVGLGALERLGELVPGEGPVAMVADAQGAGIHGMDAQLARGGRLVSTHEVAGKSAADLERLWRALKLDR